MLWAWLVHRLFFMSIHSAIGVATSSKKPRLLVPACSSWPACGLFPQFVRVVAGPRVRAGRVLRVPAQQRRDVPAAERAPAPGQSSQATGVVAHVGSRALDAVPRIHAPFAALFATLFAALSLVSRGDVLAPLRPSFRPLASFLPLVWYRAAVWCARMLSRPSPPPSP